MITSMTGFGRGEHSNDQFSATVEIQSLNNRYCDVSARLPHQLQEYESDVRERIQAQFERGKFNLSIRVEQVGSEHLDVTFDPEVAKGYHKLLSDLISTTQIDDSIRLDHLLNFNNLFQSKKHDQETIEQMWDSVSQALDTAIVQLRDMREQEGRQLEKDLKQRLTDINDRLQVIQEKTKERMPEVRDQLMERIGELVDDDALDPERLELEVAVLADKMDITEETVRLESHIKFFDEALDNEDAVGRRLNFLLQEMNREANTIGSKANDSEISHLVVFIKENLEKLREQIQNIE
ncbi:MAG: YicC/YloC family endoribonuclease [Bacteroidota bacterium]